MSVRVESQPKHLPHLTSFNRQPIVFLTVCTDQRRPLLANQSAHEALRTVWTEAAHRYGWHVGRYVLMPDHVHLFARAGFEGGRLARWIQTWKSLSARSIAAGTGQQPPIWQRDYFDRFMRSAESYSKAWRYVWENPLRAGLVDDPADWPYGGAITELRQSG